MLGFAGAFHMHDGMADSAGENIPAVRVKGKQTEDTTDYKL